MPCSAPQVAIADPSLVLEPHVLAGWYLGSEGADLPTKVVGFLRDFSLRLGLQRRVYVGGSAGGFAALMLAGMDSGSVAVAAGPQANLLRYQPGRKYLREYFLSTLAFPERANLWNALSGSWRNSAVISVSPGDKKHLFGQIIPLVEVLSDQNDYSVILHSEYYGKPGHSGAVPQRVVNSWLLSVLEEPVFHAQAVLDARNQPGNHPENVATEERAGVSQGVVDMSSRDLIMSKRLVAHLRGGEVG
jgi:hypothetical protein